MTKSQFSGRALIRGSASGKILWLDEPISFWGGINPQTGIIIDANHPQCGQCIAGTLLVLPGTRGSTASPGALLENLAAGAGPVAFILTAPDNVCLVAASMCPAIGIASPLVIDLSQQDIPRLTSGDHWTVRDDCLSKNKATH